MSTKSGITLRLNVNQEARKGSESLSITDFNIANNMQALADRTKLLQRLSYQTEVIPSPSMDVDTSSSSIPHTE